MTQKARAVTDVSTGSWMPTPINLQINAPVEGDAPFVTSGADPQGDAFEVKLAALAWPQPGPQTVTVRLRKTDSGALGVTVSLVQGNRVFASWNVLPTEFFDDYVLDLTDAQIQSITDYTDLRLRVTAGGVVTGCCPANPLPVTLYATITDGGPLNGSYLLAYDSPTGIWICTSSLGDYPVSAALTFWCDTSAGLRWTTGNTCNAGRYFAPVGDCTATTLAVFTGVDLRQCSAGQTNCTITVTT